MSRFCCANSAPSRSNYGSGGSVTGAERVDRLWVAGETTTAPDSDCTLQDAHEGKTVRVRNTARMPTLPTADCNSPSMHLS